MSVSLYDIYVSEKKQFEELPQICILYNKGKNSISYYLRDKIVSVNYTKEMKINEVWVKSGADFKWESWTYMFEHIVDKPCLLQNSIPEVTTALMSTFKEEGFFDVFLHILYNYEKENGLDKSKPMYVTPTGFGLSHTPKFTFERNDDRFLYNPNICYTKQYFDKNKIEKDVKHQPSSKEEDLSKNFSKEERVSENLKTKNNNSVVQYKSENEIYNSIIALCSFNNLPDWFPEQIEQYLNEYKTAILRENNLKLEKNQESNINQDENSSYRQRFHRKVR